MVEVLGFDIGGANIKYVKVVCGNGLTVTEIA